MLSLIVRGRMASASRASSVFNRAISRSNCACSDFVIGRISSAVMAAACRLAFHSMSPIAIATAAATPRQIPSHGISGRFR